MNNKNILRALKKNKNTFVAYKNADGIDVYMNGIYDYHVSNMKEFIEYVKSL